MKTISPKILYYDICLFAAFVILFVLTPPISLNNPATVISGSIILGIIFLGILPHLRIVELTQDGCIISWLWLKKRYQWRELVIKYDSIRNGNAEDGEGLFFFSKKVWKNNKKIESIKPIVSLDIFNYFYFIFKNENHRNQVMQKLKEWEVEISLDEKFAQQREYERIVAEKIQMREERKRLYEDRKKRKR